MPNSYYLPGIVFQFFGVSATKLTDVNVEDLLGREPIRVEMKEIYKSLKNKTILVTGGGGGSIGSELCRYIFGD